jgi:uncharacterized membrane protein
MSSGLTPTQAAALAQYLAKNTGVNEGLLAALIMQFNASHIASPTSSSAASKAAAVLAENPGSVVVLKEEDDKSTTVQFLCNGHNLDSIVVEVRKAHGAGLRVQKIDLGEAVLISKTNPLAIAAFYGALTARGISYVSYNPAVSPKSQTAYQAFVRDNFAKVRSELPLESQSPQKVMAALAVRWENSQEKKDSLAKKEAARLAKKSPTTPVHEPVSPTPAPAI